MQPSNETKQLAEYLQSLVGSRPTITRYYDEAERSHVDILAAPDDLTKNVVTYATLGLSDHDNAGTRDGPKPLRVELLMAARDYFEDVPNILSTCAFNIINSGMQGAPGRIFPRVVELYYPELPLTDIFLASPFLWRIETQKFPSKTVAWLLAAPISKGETAYAMQNGPDALETQFERHSIDIFDLERPPIF